MELNEKIYLGSCLLRPELIDEGSAAGVQVGTFRDAASGEIWARLVQLRAKDQPVDETALLQSGADLAAIVEIQGAAPTAQHGRTSMNTLLEQKRLRDAESLILAAQEAIKGGESLDAVKSLLEPLSGLLEPVLDTEESIDDACAAVIEEFMQKAGGNIPQADYIRTGLTAWDNEASPIERHELVIIGARPSVGKSSMGMNIANQAIQDGKRVAIFTLETSKRAVIAQMAAQVAGVNRKKPQSEFEDRQRRFVNEVHRLQKCGLLKVFDRDMKLEQIWARCRLLAKTWKPDVVIIDYLNIIRTAFGKSQYEKITHISSEMISLRKTLDCPLICLAQFNRNPASEGRAPTMADFRDSGKVEEDGHRIWAIHRPLKDDAGMDQIGQMDQLVELHQLKLRDGALCYQRARFNAPHAKFYQ